MFSVPHLVVIFIVVLVIFGPHKLPELARGLGKMMAEFRKASTDFRMAFEEEMRNIERQAREAEYQKAQQAAATQSAALPAAAETPRIPPESTAPIEPVLSPVAEAIAHGSQPAEEQAVSPADPAEPDSGRSASADAPSSAPAHDHQPSA